MKLDAVVVAVACVRDKVFNRFWSAIGVELKGDRTLSGFHREGFCWFVIAHDLDGCCRMRLGQPSITICFV